MRRQLLQCAYDVDIEAGNIATIAGNKFSIISNHRFQSGTSNHRFFRLLFALDYPITILKQVLQGCQHLKCCMVWFTCTAMLCLLGLGLLEGTSITKKSVCQTLNITIRLSNEDVNIQIIQAWLNTFYKSTINL